MDNENLSQKPSTHHSSRQKVLQLLPFSLRKVTTFYVLCLGYSFWHAHGTYSRRHASRVTGVSGNLQPAAGRRATSGAPRFPAKNTSRDSSDIGSCINGSRSGQDQCVFTSWLPGGGHGYHVSVATSQPGLLILGWEAGADPGRGNLGRTRELHKLKGARRWCYVCFLNHTGKKKQYLIVSNSFSNFSVMGKSYLFYKLQKQPFYYETHLIW